MCSALAHVCFGPKADISEQAPKLSYLFFVGRAASPRTCRRCQDHLHYRTHGKHAREMLVEDSHRYHSISHGWGPLIIRTTGKMPSRPSPRASEGERFKAISPGMLPPLGIIFGLFCRVHWAVHTWERGQPREPLSRTGRCSITVLPPSRPFCQSRLETRRLGAGA
jgi:hypothetical protein